MSLVTYLVEDNQIILARLIETLEEMADVSIKAHTGSQTEAIHWLMQENRQWDLAIVDLFLIEGNGLGILEGCQRRDSHQKMVVLTNYATAEIRRRAAELGADALFDKSEQLEDLVAYCESQVKNSNLLSNNKH